VSERSAISQEDGEIPELLSSFIRVQLIAEPLGLLADKHGQLLAELLVNERGANRGLGARKQIDAPATPLIGFLGCDGKRGS
jgi:hypothetical protein